MMAVLLPVAPTVGLKQGVLAAVGLGSGSAGGAAAAVGAGAATAGSLGTVTIAKVAVVVVAVGGAGAGGERLLDRAETRAVPAAAPSSSADGGRTVTPPTFAGRASQAPGHVRTGKAQKAAKSRVGDRGRSYGSERRGGVSDRASALGRVKQDRAPTHAGPNGNRGRALGRAKKLASAPTKPVKRKLPRAKSKAEGRTLFETKPGKVPLP
jgi:hypothetical protein